MLLTEITPGNRSLKELDQQWRQPKGTAFRAFRSLETELVEGRDFIVLHPVSTADRFAKLSALGRLHPGTQRAIILSQNAARKVDLILAAKSSE